jgi:hypothetical protein
MSTLLATVRITQRKQSVPMEPKYHVYELVL